MRHERERERECEIGGGGEREHIAGVSVRGASRVLFPAAALHANPAGAADGALQPADGARQQMEEIWSLSNARKMSEISPSISASSSLTDAKSMASSLATTRRTLARCPLVGKQSENPTRNGSSRGPARTVWGSYRVEVGGGDRAGGRCVAVGTWRRRPCRRWRAVVAPPSQCLPLCSSRVEVTMMVAARLLPQGTAPPPLLGVASSATARNPSSGWGRARPQPEREGESPG